VGGVLGGEKVVKKHSKKGVCHVEKTWMVKNGVDDEGAHPGQKENSTAKK